MECIIHISPGHVFSKPDTEIFVIETAFPEEGENVLVCLRVGFFLVVKNAAPAELKREILGSKSSNIFYRDHHERIIFHVHFEKSEKVIVFITGTGLYAAIVVPPFPLSIIVTAMIAGKNRICIRVGSPELKRLTTGDNSQDDEQYGRKGAGFNPCRSSRTLWICSSLHQHRLLAMVGNTRRIYGGRYAGMCGTVLTGSRPFDHAARSRIS